MTQSSQVLIESDWNLKLLPYADDYYIRNSINRIRLEFKVFHIGNGKIMSSGINRIRLEFKVG